MSAFSKSLKPIFENISKPILEFLSKYNVEPNTLSILGVIVTAIGSYFVYDDYGVFGGLIILIGGFFDALDGALARMNNKESLFGAFLDSTLDRISDALPVSALILIFFKNQDKIGIFIGLICIVFSFLVSYTKARAHSLGKDIPIGTFERTERFTIIVLSIIFGFYKLGLILVSIGAIYTTIERIIYAKEHL